MITLGCKFEIMKNRNVIISSKDIKMGARIRDFETIFLTDIFPIQIFRKGANVDKNLAG